MTLLDMFNEPCEVDTNLQNIPDEKLANIFYIEALFLATAKTDLSKIHQ